MNKKSDKSSRREIVLIHRTDPSPPKFWDRIEQFAKIASLIAVPIIIGIGSWLIQNALSRRSVNQDYVQLAVSILTNSDENIDQSLRSWAVELMNQNSPVEFSDAIAKKLSTGKVNLPPPPIRSLPTDEKFEPVSSFSESHPYRNISKPIGRLDLLVETLSGQEGINTCTAIAISTEHILIPAHCIQSPNSKVKKALLNLNYLSNLQLDSIEKFEVDVDPISIDNELDIAILRINGKISDSFGPLQLANRPPQFEERLVIFHHPLAKPLMVTRHDCRVTDVPTDDKGMFAHSCETFPGSGGGAVFAELDGALLGIHVKHGFAVRIDRILDSLAFSDIKIGRW